VARATANTAVKLYWTQVRLLFLPSCPSPSLPLYIGECYRTAAILTSCHRTVQFALNMAWTPLFFGLRLPLPALFDIVPLTGVTYTLAAVAYKVDPRTAIAFVPYCAWLSFATYLNGSFFSFFDVFSTFFLKLTPLLSVSLDLVAQRRQVAGQGREEGPLKSHSSVGTPSPRDFFLPSLLRPRLTGLRNATQVPSSLEKPSGVRRQRRSLLTPQAFDVELD
jgi:hypothetical protein